MDDQDTIFLEQHQVEKLLEAILSGVQQFNIMLEGDEDLNSVEEMLKNSRDIFFNNHSFFLMAVVYAAHILREKSEEYVLKVGLDELDKKILEITKKDPDINDLKLGFEVGLTRQALNTRRRTLGRLGFKVR